MKRVVLEELQETRGKSQEHTQHNTGPAVSLIQPFDNVQAFNSSMCNIASNSNQSKKKIKEFGHASHHEPGAADLGSVKRFRKEYRSKMEQRLQEQCLMVNETAK
jgi:hypothetical protein